MENCLVTKLKANVQNDNLPTLGILKVHIDYIDGATERQSALRLFSSDSEIIVECEGNNIATTYAGLSNPTNKLVFHPYSPSDANFVYFKNGTYSVKIASKYGLTSISNEILDNYGKSIVSVAGVDIPGITNLKGLTINGANTTLDLSVLSDFSLSTLKISNSNNITGDLSSLSNMVSLVKLTLNKKITGNLTDLSKLVNLTSIWFDQNTTNYFGDWKDFVAGQVAEGRTTCADGTFGLTYIGGCTRFNGVSVNSFNQSYISWESSSKIAIKGISAQFVYTMGYTAEEAAAAFPGYTVVRTEV
jgi:hypothetical protein